MNSKTARETERDLKKKKKVFFFFVCVCERGRKKGRRENVCFPFTYVCALCVSGSGGAQKRVSEPPGIEAWGMVCESLVGAGKPNLAWSQLSSPTSEFYLIT